MPSDFCYDKTDKRNYANELAKKQVKAKFPDLQIDSTGWHKAVNNRRLRILNQL